MWCAIGGGVCGRRSALCGPPVRTLLPVYPSDRRLSSRGLAWRVSCSTDPRRSDRTVLNDPTTEESTTASGVQGAVEFDCPPWDAWTSWKVMLQVLCLTVPLSQGGVPLVAELLGSSVDQLSAAEIAWTAVFMEVIQLFGVGVLLWAGTKEWSSSKRWLRFEVTPRALVQGVGTSLAAAAAALSLAFVTTVVGDGWWGGPAETPIGQALLETSDASATVGASVLAVLLAPVLEELIYRGFLLPSLLKRLEPATAVVATSSVFAASHCNPKMGPDFFVAGCAYGAGYVVSGGNLAVATLGHALYNLSVVVQSIAL